MLLFPVHVTQCLAWSLPKRIYQTLSIACRFSIFFHNYHNHISGIYVLGWASSLQHLLVAFPRLCSCATPHPSSQTSQSVVLRWTTCRPRCLVVQYMCTHSFQQCNNLLLPIRDFLQRRVNPGWRQIKINFW